MSSTGWKSTEAWFTAVGIGLIAAADTGMHAIGMGIAVGAYCLARGMTKKG